ncbi:Fe(3+) ABC transporter substrate-binding protein [Limibacillus halophilus]|uniref:Iron(III) transport system substrate-binding protein n=1 Tax=Limibacillus halophilus TaxID=1579333 RepID=A0A839SSI1_9PROT|nr:Fe(3+) ABC transporter substrate-binding protein [Limibacillus halophilus]MBB3064670.1 iron(III) transport system substrate-binding protein [Limibacillus halophilus]
MTYSRFYSLGSNDRFLRNLHRSKVRRATTGAVAALAVAAGSILAGWTLGVSEARASEEQVVNLYSSRHYQTDEALYAEFTAATGIKVNRIEADGDALIERMKSEGANSPADVVMTVDAGRLWRAEEAGLFQSAESTLLDQKIPANLRHPDGLWFGFSSRARLIVYNKKLVDPTGLDSYEDLADPKWKGLVCIRSSSNIYNLSLLGSIIAADGEEKAEAWAKGVVANFARDPQGGDTDQLRAAASGECGIAVANSYYLVRLLRSDKSEDQEVGAALGVIFPNQDGRGTHVNVSGAGVAKHAPHKEAAIKFLEYLASDSAQQYFADGNNEYPVVEGVAANAAVTALGSFKIDTVNVSVLGKNQPLAQMIFDRAGWK